ncbi:Uncharacterized protein T02_9551 [Trichinella nativa]|uniref:Uncharacterized protein n=1 Tax=Trichinella nativa TaxID=6335 RepID=A0A0V1KZK3_9BILA|nr:Uncharacterized protein T02_9551 [Trichinella nativa]
MERIRFVILGFLNPYHWDVKVLIDEFAEWKDFESLPSSEVKALTDAFNSNVRFNAGASSSHLVKKIKVPGRLYRRFICCLRNTYLFNQIISHWASFKKSDKSLNTCWLICRIYNPELYFDMRGSLMMMSFLNYHLELEKLMWILSTFGGAFSAYGDYFEDFAVKASAISVKQLEIAMKLGNPVLISRCKLYLSLSLIQRGYFRLAKRIIREQFKLWEKVEVSDGNLIRRICRGIWTRLNNEKRRHMLSVQ